MVALARDREIADALVQETFIRVMGHMGLLEQLNHNQGKPWVFHSICLLLGWAGH